jgi:SNW domain-containing protein 1
MEKSGQNSYQNFMTLKAVLPKPKHTLSSSKWASSEPEITPKKNRIPPYGQRQDFIPEKPKDFGDGGAFPEIHIVQYPLGMGKKMDVGAEISETIPLQTDADGSIRYDLVLHKGHELRDDKVIHASADAMKSKDYDASLRPDDEVVAKTAQETKEAIDKLMDARSKFAKPKGLGAPSSGPTFVKYVPSENSLTSTGTSKIIRLSEAPVDPLEPPRFKHRKIPRSAGSPPPPVLRSPPRKVTVEEQKNWVVPPCISNWKNAKGYTIPLDKRLANDGRGLQDITINDKFAKFSEALFIADRHARDEVKLRAEMQTNLAMKQKKEKEDKLRQLAQKAREERAGLTEATGANALIKMYCMTKVLNLLHLLKMKMKN